MDGIRKITYLIILLNLVITIFIVGNSLYKDYTGESKLISTYEEDLTGQLHPALFNPINY